MQVKVIFESDNVPIAYLFGKPTLGRVKLVRVPSFPGHKHLDREPSRPCISNIDPLFATHRRQKVDREPPVGVLLANSPSPVPVLVLDKVRNPIHAPTVAKPKNVGNSTTGKRIVFAEELLPSPSAMTRIRAAADRYR